MPQTQTLNADRSRALPGRIAHSSAHSSAQGAWLACDEVIMGTAIHAQVWADTPAVGQAAVAAVMQEMRRIDQAMSSYKEASELSRINRDAARMAVPISDEMFRLIERAIEFSELSHGAFDITYAGVGHLYDYRQRTLPTDAQRDAARAAVGYRNLILDCAARTVRFARDGVRIDLGGFAKGHAVDNSIALLRQHGIEHAIVSAGGDSHVLGDRRGRPWTIAVRDPRRADRVVAVLPLEDTSISTSGDYERYFERDGVRHHHLIDPKTGSSPRALHSVTILAADGLTTEGLSKSVFVLGLEEGMRLVESLPGVDAIVVDAAGTLHFSSGLLDGRPQPGGDTRQ